MYLYRTPYNTCGLFRIGIFIYLFRGVCSPSMYIETYTNAKTKSTHMYLYRTPYNTCGLFRIGIFIYLFKGGTHPCTNILSCVYKGTRGHTCSLNMRRQRVAAQPPAAAAAPAPIRAVPPGGGTYLYHNPAGIDLSQGNKILTTLAQKIAKNNSMIQGEIKSLLGGQKMPRGGETLPPGQGLPTSGLTLPTSSTALYKTTMRQTITKHDDNFGQPIDIFNWIDIPPAVRSTYSANPYIPTAIFTLR